MHCVFLQDSLSLSLKRRRSAREKKYTQKQERQNKNRQIRNMGGIGRFQKKANLANATEPAASLDSNTSHYDSSGHNIGVENGVVLSGQMNFDFNEYGGDVARPSTGASFSHFDVSNMVDMISEEGFSNNAMEGMMLDENEDMGVGEGAVAGAEIMPAAEQETEITPHFYDKEAIVSTEGDKMAHSNEQDRDERMEDSIGIGRATDTEERSARSFLASLRLRKQHEVENEAKLMEEAQENSEMVHAIETNALEQHKLQLDLQVLHKQSADLSTVDIGQKETMDKHVDNAFDVENTMEEVSFIPQLHSEAQDSLVIEKETEQESEVAGAPMATTPVILDATASPPQDDHVAAESESKETLDAQTNIFQMMPASCDGASTAITKQSGQAYLRGVSNSTTAARPVSQASPRSDHPIYATEGLIAIHNKLPSSAAVNLASVNTNGKSYTLGFSGTQSKPSQTPETMGNTKPQMQVKQPVIKQPTAAKQSLPALAHTAAIPRPPSSLLMLQQSSTMQRSLAQNQMSRNAPPTMMLHSDKTQNKVNCLKHTQEVSISTQNTGLTKQHTPYVMPSNISTQPSAFASPMHSLKQHSPVQQSSQAASTVLMPPPATVTPRPMISSSKQGPSHEYERYNENNSEVLSTPKVFASQQKGSLQQRSSALVLNSTSLIETSEESSTPTTHTNMNQASVAKPVSSDREVSMEKHVSSGREVSMAKQVSSDRESTESFDCMLTNFLMDIRDVKDNLDISSVAMINMEVEFAEVYNQALDMQGKMINSIESINAAMLYAENSIASAKEWV